METKITSEVKNITPDFAGELLKRNTRNRNINRLTVEDYASQMRKGGWKLNGEPIIISESGVILDGQHRLLACQQAGVTIPSLIVYGAKDDTFTTIDTGRVRTAGDMFTIDGITEASQKAAIISAYFALRRNDSTFVNTEGLRKIKASKAEVLDFYYKNKNLVDNIIKLSQRCYSKVRLLTRSTLGAYSLYLILDKKHPFMTVANFFDELFGIATPSNQTITLLYDTYIRHITKQRVLTPTQKNVYLIKTWNAYITDKELKNLSWNKAQEIEVHFI